MPRFVVLEHDHPHLHWDLMLEADGVLRTWRLAEPPESGKTVVAEALDDHRLHYLDYEGPVSGGRGEVVRWDAGEFTTVAKTPDRWEFALDGLRRKGVAVLVRSAERTWRLIYRTQQEEKEFFDE
jgi:hypothetical protein